MDFRDALTEGYKGNVTTEPIVALGSKLAMLTKYNNTSESYLAIAEFLGEKSYIAELKEIIAEKNRSGANDAYDRTYAIYKKLMAIGRKKFSKTDWDKYVYKNT